MKGNASFLHAIRAACQGGALPDKSQRLWVLAGCLLLLLSLLLRSWQTLFHSAFYVEDGLLFSLFYGGNQPFFRVANNYFGQPYWTLLSTVFAWVYAHADVRLHAVLYQWTGFVFGMAAACSLFFPGLIKTKPVLLFGPLLLGLTGLNHIYYYNTLIYVMYTAVLLLLALLFFPPPENRPIAWLALPFILLLPWAGPYSLMAIPASLLLLLFCWDNRKKRWLLLAVCVSTVLYFLTVEGSTVKLANATKWWVIKYYFQVLLERIILLDLFGHVSSWLWLAVLAFVGGSLFLFRDDSVYLMNSLVLFVLIGGALSLFFFSVKLPLYLGPNVCHRLVSFFFWCFFLIYTADKYLMRYRCHGVAASVFILLLLSIVVVDNMHNPRKRGAVELAETKEFLDDVYRMEQLLAQESGQFVVLKLHNPQTPTMSPQAIVGRRVPGARQLMPEDFEEPQLSHFISRNGPR